MFLSDVPPLSTNFIPIHEQQYLCGSCGIWEHTPRRSLTTCALGKGQADPSWGCRTSRSLRTGHSPSQLQLGKTRKVMTWVDTYGWESLCRNPAFRRRNNSIPIEKKKVWVWMHWRGKRELCQHCPSSKAAQRRAELARDILLHRGKTEWSGNAQLPSPVGHW